MPSLDSPRWAELQHAYSCAALESSPEHAAGFLQWLQAQ